MTTPTTIEERVSRLEGGSEHLATKADMESVKVDLQHVRAELKEDIGNLRAELRKSVGGLRAELKGDIGNLRAELKAEIRDSKISTIVWLTGIMITLLGISIAIQRAWPA